ncbi:MAG: exo-alpha-sialidase [Ignavibacteria bacterium]|nr:exo-alpha-sialidase [Ignavibacteria bacterium]
MRPSYYVIIIALIIAFQKQKEYPSVSAGSRFPNLLVENGHLAMVWFEVTDTSKRLLFSEMKYGEWTTPTTITLNKNFFINWADFPSLYSLGGDTLAVHYLEKGGSGTYDYNVKVRFSYNHGKTWTSGEIVHNDSSHGEHGFVSFFRMNNNTHGIVWLDGRFMPSEDEENSHDGHGGDMSLYATTFSSQQLSRIETVLDNRVCECCPTSALQTETGIIVAYRNRDETEIRNINIIRFENGNWGEPITVHDDNWQIPGCPVNGPVLVGKGKSVACVWYTAPDNSPEVKIAFSNDEGKTFAKPISVSKKLPLGRVDALWLNDGSVLVSWIEQVEQMGELCVVRVNKNGKISPHKIIAEIDVARGSGYPKMELFGEKIFFALTKTGEETKIETKWMNVEELE